MFQYEVSRKSYVNKAMLKVDLHGMHHAKIVPETFEYKLTCLEKARTLFFVQII